LDLSNIHGLIGGRRDDAVCRQASVTDENRAPPPKLPALLFDASAGSKWKQRKWKIAMGEHQN
jgi:hypothetical protein